MKFHCNAAESAKSMRVAAVVSSSFRNVAFFRTIVTNSGFLFLFWRIGQEMINTFFLIFDSMCNLSGPEG